MWTVTLLFPLLESSGIGGELLSMLSMPLITLIAVIILAGYGFYLVLERNQGLVQLGLISFVAVAQFLPGVFGLLFE